MAFTDAPITDALSLKILQQYLSLMHIPITKPIPIYEGNSRINGDYQIKQNM